MIEIDERARQAIESPVAYPPEMARIAALAAGHRRRRTRLRTSLVVVVASVVVVAFVALIALPSDNSALRVTAKAPTTVSSTAISSRDESFAIADLRDRLAEEGHAVVADGTASGAPLASNADLLCVDGTQVRVYQYHDLAARVVVSDGISPDGSKITLPLKGSSNKVMLVGWIASPHFFAKGRVIVLVLGDDTRVREALTRILGQTLSPQAPETPQTKAPCASQGH